MSSKLDQIQPLEAEAWGDAPPLTGHTLFAEAATEKQRADLANMTLATLCDMVLGEDAPDRSDDALVRAVGMLKRERDVLATELERDALAAEREQLLDHIASLVQEGQKVEAERDAAQDALEFAQKYWMDAVAERDADAGTRGFVFERNEGKPHSKMTVFRVVRARHYDITLSQFLNNATRGLA